MNQNRVKEILEYVKGSPETMNYGRWRALNPEQRKSIKELCNSWLILDDATNIQIKEIERLQFKNKKLQTILKTRARQDRKRKAKVRKYREELTNQRLKIERLNNIIKEVREYINGNEDYFYNYPLVSREHLLKILDKVGSDKE